MPALQIGADFADAFNKLDALNAKLGKQGEAIGQVSSQIQKYNAAGQLTSTTTTQLIADFTRLIETQRVLKDGSTQTTQKFVTDQAAIRAASDSSAKAQIAAMKDALASRKVFYDTVRRLAEEDAALNTRNARLAQQAARESFRQDAAREASIARRAQLMRQSAAEDAAYNSRLLARGAGSGFINGGGRNGGPAFGPTGDDNARASAFDAALNRIGRNLIQFASFRAFNFISNAFSDGIKGAKEFQIQLSLIRTLSQDKQQTFGKFGQDVRGVSDASGTDIKQVGKAFYDTISNQVAKGSAVKEFVKTATDLARVTGSEVPDATNALSSAINAFGLSAHDAERVAAVFFRTVDEGRIVLSEVGNTIGRVDVLASNLGISMESVRSVLAITTQKGFKTADAMTLLTNLMIKLEKPTEATAGFFKELGVSSGESAIRLYGFTGLLQKMVDAVKSGKVDISAFFDEIRGRKQFGIFEQSIDEIKRFEDQLKDVTATKKIYDKAVEIRGESPADQLIKEFNKLSNIFKVDLGQGILKFAADVIKGVGGVEALKNAASNTVEGVKFLALGLVTYTVYAKVATIATLGLARAITIPLAGAAAAAARFLLPVAAAYAAFKVGQNLFGAGKEIFADLDTSKLNGTVEALGRLKEAQEKLSQGKGGENPFKSIAEQQKVIDSTYKDFLGLVARANIANNKFLDDAKMKSKEAADAIKITFAGWVDTMKGNISEIKKAISEAKNEIDKTTKGGIKFKDTLDEALFNSKLKYSTDDIRLGNQKVEVIQQRIDSLTARAKQLYASENKDEVEEGRQLFNELAKLEEQKFDLKTDYARRQFEKGLEGSGATGLQVFKVDPSVLAEKLNSLAALRNQLDATHIANQKTIVASKETQLKQEETKLLKLQAAFDKFERLDVLTKDGKVNEQFRGADGKVDRGKLATEMEKIQAEIRANAGGSMQDRVKLELELSKMRIALFAEVGAKERQENLKTAEARIETAREAQSKDLETIKKVRQEAGATQKNLLEGLGQKPDELRAFQKTLFAGGGRGLGSRTETAFKEQIAGYEALLKELNDDANANAKDGIPQLNPEKLAAVKQKYDDIIKALMAVRDLAGRNTDLTTDIGGQKVSPGFGKAAIDQQVEEILKNKQKIDSTYGDEAAKKEAFGMTTGKQIEQLKASLPELVTTADAATKSIAMSFNGLTTGEIQKLKLELLEIQKLMQSIGGGIDGKKKVSLDTPDGAVYAASGGIAGLFPGQPRGVDRYPIWAAAGETIVDAETSSMYRPMLNSIMNRRMPRYMSMGGVVGDTNIGDINVTVQGGRTNDQTGRALGNMLERQLRFNNIRLEKKK